MKLNFIKKPTFNEFSLFDSPQDLKQNIIESHQFIFDLRFETKTYISILVQSGKTRFKFNEHSDYSKENNLNLVEKSEMNYLSGRIEVNRFFKLTKKQNLKVLKKHLESLAIRLLRDLHIHELVNPGTLTVNVYTPSSILESINQS